jgi:hypothetical protein
LALALALTGPSEPVHPQAAVPATLHVSQRDSRAADANAGSETAPLRSIGEAARRAMANRRQSIGTRVIIHPGIYRERVTLRDARADPAAPPIVFEGTKSEAVVVSGAEVLTGWQRAVDADVYRRAWPYNLSEPPLPDGWEPVAGVFRDRAILRRRELVIVNGQRFEQVLSLVDMRGRERTFFLENNGSRGIAPVMWIHVPEGTRPDQSVIEAGVRPKLLDVDGVGNLTVRNLVFLHAVSGIQDAAVTISGSASVTVEASEISSNNWLGLGAYESRDVTLRQVTANANGAGGFGVWRVRNFVAESSEASYNNWRGGSGGFTSWAVGQKLVSVHGARFTRYRAVGNRSSGLWLDTDNVDVVVEESHLCQNETDGLFLEASSGPIVVRRSRVCDNRDAGVLASAAARVRLEDNVIAGNGREQISIPWLADEHVSTDVVDHETGVSGPVRTRQWSMTGNLVSAEGDAFLIGAASWSWFLDTLTSRSNRWTHTNRPDAFGVHAAKGTPPERLDFRQWRAATDADEGSTFELRSHPSSR